jgi:hypothetical protein
MSSYEIRVRGQLDAHWATWFAGLTLVYEGDTTVLRGFLADEAALHGVLTKIAGLNLHLLSVNAVETGEAAADTSAGIGREPDARDARDALDAPPSETAVNEAAPKKKTGTRRKRPRKRPNTKGSDTPSD